MARQYDDLLLEIVTEELPAKSLQRLSQALESGLTEKLVAAQLDFKVIKRFATPRRLALRVDHLASQQPELEIKRRGPAVSTAFDAAGKPTAAGLGFARACGCGDDMSALTEVESDKGRFLQFCSVESGRLTIELLPQMITEVIAVLPIAKGMRWGSGEVSFVRPVHHLILMLGYEVVETELLGIASNNISVGHRFHYPSLVMIQHPNEYEVALERAQVMVSMTQRQKTIVEQLQPLAEEVAGQIVWAEGLLDEVTALVEWPQALRGNFAERFLQLPREVLVTSLQQHQKCFTLADNAGQLKPYFITVSNIESHDPQQVVCGNERVVEARLSDAEFFYKVDRQQTLADRITALKQMLFHKQLGTLHDKTERVCVLAECIATQLQADVVQAKRAAQLAKTDLLTQMVEEFHSLQGVMGRYYAEHDGEAPAVAQALYEQYLPRFAEDDLPQTAVGQSLALADRLDTLVGIFAINKAPSGDKDPFALRRAALGVIRLLIEQRLVLDLRPLIDQAVVLYDDNLPNSEVKEEVWQFIHQRHRHLSLRQGFSSDGFEAVAAIAPNSLYDFRQRLQAVEAFRQLPAATALAAANKRVKNVLTKATVADLAVDPAHFAEPAEQQLFELMTAQQRVDSADYTECLTELATLRQGVDRFFDEVMVMADDKAIRNNRLALLTALRQLFLQVADISLLSDGS
ncbi:MAG: glycine--tRNA ligase subunit beta [Gammaproteobacteria bacterium]|nr:glycine--tRNA ligase subunit beta [Gammaproteobacteria bacterium]